MRNAVNAPLQCPSAVGAKQFVGGLSDVVGRWRVDFFAVLANLAAPQPGRRRLLFAMASFRSSFAGHSGYLHRGAFIRLGLAAAGALGGVQSLAADSAAAAKFHRTIEPLLTKYCYDCHGNGLNKGKVSFDEFASDAELLARRDLWLAVLKNVRAGLMPPKEDGDEALRPTEGEVRLLADWIKYDAFGIDPANPDPGHVTARRLNRVEYRNTIRDLMGTEFNAEAEFPPDDTGNGFDNMGEVLTISPLHLEKYLAAAEAIVDRAVPKVGRVMREVSVTGRDFRNEPGGETGNAGGGGGGGGRGGVLSVKRAATVTRKFSVERDDTYKISVELEARGSFDFDPNRCQLICRTDGRELFSELVEWSEKKAISRAVDVEWTAGDHVVSFEVVPMEPVPTPTKPERRIPTDLPVADGAEKAKAAGEEVAAVVAGAADDKAVPGAAPAGAAALVVPRRPPPAQASRLDVAIVSVKLSGPRAKEFWIAPDNHARFFPDGPAPENAAARDAYAAKVLRQFATRAFRRPVDEKKVTQLVQVARSIYTRPDKTFEEGIGRAMMAVLASPRFLFRIEEPEPVAAEAAYAPVDEYSLASRLSYFLWSTMPDEELFDLAQQGQLRKELAAQVQRMLKDPKASQGLVRNFTGQWLQARDIEFVPINARAVLGINTRGQNDNAPRVDFDGPLRKFMRSETEMYFEHVLRDDRSVIELIDSDYTFLNARLATHYGVPNVTGDQLRLVKLPADSPRGGILTQGTFLAVTSNPTRTSPVKRGLFVLENILGTPTPPPPPNVPDLEESKKEIAGREPKLSEVLALHRANALCSSCHQRMDPLGLAFENFNAMGSWRDEEAKQPIDPAGKLITGENFKNVRELKHVLVTERRLDFYRCLTEKMLMYALGRGLDYRDTVAVDTIVDRLVREDGRMSALMTGVIESVPFQKQHAQPSSAVTAISPTQATVAKIESKP